MGQNQVTRGDHRVDEQKADSTTRHGQPSRENPARGVIHHMWMGNDVAKDWLWQRWAANAQGYDSFETDGQGLVCKANQAA